MGRTVMKLEYPFAFVKGLLAPQDKDALRELAQSVATIPGNMAEIGSYQGLSALCLLSGNAKVLLCFDYFEEDKLIEFNKNLSNAEARHRVYLMPGNFRDRADIIATHWFSLVFVDHSHTLEDTKAAYDLFWPRLSAGGVIAFHDYEHPSWPEATEFLKTLPHRRVLETNMIAFQKE
jgi:predicted O-methyltransferase YrrM